MSEDESDTTTAACIEWLERIEKFQGVDPTQVRPMAGIIRAKLQAAEEMAVALSYINEATRGTRWARAAAPPLSKWHEATT